LIARYSRRIDGSLVHNLPIPHPVRGPINNSQGRPQSPHKSKERRTNSADLHPFSIARRYPALIEALCATAPWVNSTHSFELQERLPNAATRLRRLSWVARREDSRPHRSVLGKFRKDGRLGHWNSAPGLFPWPLDCLIAMIMLLVRVAVSGARPVLAHRRAPLFSHRQQDRLCLCGAVTRRINWMSRQ